MTSVDNGYHSAAKSALQVGDAILSLDGALLPPLSAGCPVSTVADTNEKVLEGLKEKRYVELVLERPNDEATLRQVLLASG